ncbi:MAG: hypothetical protein RLZZ241_2497 [Bacteroidota bacterium]
MIRNTLLQTFTPVAFVILLSGCGPKPVSRTLLEFNNATVQKTSNLTEEESKSWGHMDLLKDTVPGMSVDRAYSELLVNSAGNTVVVAVLDSGIDLEHEDLDGVLWTNADEIPNNGKDDDQNGFVDDIHGYNFLGESYHEQLEAARIVRLSIGDAALQAKAKSVLDQESAEARSNKARYDQILGAVEAADQAVKQHLESDSYNQEDVEGIQTNDPELQQHLSVIRQMYNFDSSIEGILSQLREGINYFSDRLNYHFNTTFNGRTIVGDNPYDLNDRGYGNGNPKNRVADESHGTHVAGIIAAERNNGIGVNGVADRVQIMSVRTVPDGDEYDKDVALAIRYATDNGAQIINASFGKPFSPNSEWVKEALIYAAKKDVLFVHAAGNDALDLDRSENENYPTDQVAAGPEYTNNVLTVGSLDNTYGSEMVSSFSNYGATSVDVFAPGGQIYSTMPGNQYDFQGGTSMAAPAVSGIAAILRSRFPKLSAVQVKEIIMSSGLSITEQVALGGDSENKKPLGAASRTGRIVNLYNALILAEQVNRGSKK